PQPPAAGPSGSRSRGRSATRARRARGEGRRTRSGRLDVARGSVLAGVAFAAPDLEQAARALPRLVAPLHRRAAAQARLAHEGTVRRAEDAAVGATTSRPRSHPIGMPPNGSTGLSTVGRSEN